MSHVRTLTTGLAAVLAAVAAGGPTPWLVHVDETASRPLKAPGVGGPRTPANAGGVF